MTKSTHARTSSASSDAGEIRLIQAYLRALGQFGEPSEVRGIDVVSGALTTRTRNACARFMQANHGQCNLTTQQQVDGVIATLRRAHNATLTTNGVDDSLAKRNALMRAFDESSAQQRYPELAHMHPQMRFPLAAALDDLRADGIDIVINEGYRPPMQQEALVMRGNSTAVPSWSLHGYGLAVDITPRNDSSAHVLNPQTAAWQKTLAVMQRYGFYSLYANQGWDLQHFELPASTVKLRQWPNGRDGYKDIPSD